MSSADAWRSVARAGRARAVPTQLYIGGRVARGDAAAARWRSRTPPTGETLVEVADGQPQDALAALGAAADAQAEWAATAPRERGEILRRAYEEIVAQTDELALLMTLEMGKALAESRAEIAYAAEFFRWFSEEAVRIHGRYMVNTTGKGRILTMRQPVGPCVFVTPWNFPTAMGTRKIAPAIAAGCTMVVKPAQQTPLSMLALAQILEQAGLPGGRAQRDHGQALGRGDRAAAARRAHAQAVVHRLDRGRAHADRAVRRSRCCAYRWSSAATPRSSCSRTPTSTRPSTGAMLAKMRNVGEACTAANRFHVHESRGRGVRRGLAERMGALKVGRGTEPDVDVGPLIDADQRAKVTELVDDAVARGARVLVGGERASPVAATSSRRRSSPTCPTTRALLSEEIFGPVAPIATFSTEAQALEAANRTEYGLVAYVYTRDLSRALRVCEGIETGMVGLNQGVVSNPAAPFGGVKQSGFGREGGFEGIGEYLETKYVAMAV